MNISKENLLSLIKENLEEMAMNFDTPDRPHSDVQNALGSTDTPYKKVPLPKTNQEPQNNFQELLASERYKQVVSRIQQYTGINTPLKTDLEIAAGPLMMMMHQAHENIILTERNHRKQLEELAVRLVMKEMAIPEGAINYEAKIVGLGEIDMSDFNRELQQNPNIDEVDVEKDLYDDLESLDLERAKRRLINGMIQGAAKRGHYMYHYVADEIRQITGSDTLLNNYGILMSINDTLYWQLSNDIMKMLMNGGGEGGHPGGTGGKERVDRNTEPPTIYAEAINFPTLVHELIKGTMELFAVQGQPEDPAVYEKVSELEDTYEKEAWDIRLGPPIWDRIRSLFPDEILTNEEKQELQNYLLVEIFKLPAKNFLVLMKEVISKSEQGKRLLDEIAKGVELMVKDQDYSEAMETFKQDLDNISDNTDDDGLNDFLNQFGLHVPDGDDQN